MKRYITLLALLLAVVINTDAAQTNVLAEAKETAKTMVATNINQVMVEILTGVKVASGEVYSASKVAVGQAYDFVKKETPQVIVEFLRWKLVECCIWMGVWGSISILLFIFAWKLSAWRKKATPANSDNDSREMSTAFKWIFRAVACLLLVINLGWNGMTMGKIISAPRVYIIEYVVDAINGPAHR